MKYKFLHEKIPFLNKLKTWNFVLITGLMSHVYERGNGKMCAYKIRTYNVRIKNKKKTQPFSHQLIQVL